LKFIRFTTNMVAGLGSLQEAPSFLSQNGFPPRALIVTGSTHSRPIGEELLGALKGQGFTCEVLALEGGATEENARTLLGRARELGAQALLGVGGGSIIDLCKYCAKALGLQLAVVPTNLASDAIASPFSVIWSDGSSRAERTMVPNFIIGDYDVLMKEPHRFVAAGFADMLAKYTALFDWRLAFWLGDEPYMDFAAQLAESVMNLIVRRASDIAQRNYIGVETLFYAEVHDGYLMELAGTTRVAAGSEHLIAFSIDRVLQRGPQALHGFEVALGTIIAAYLQGRDWRMVRELLRQVGAPTRAEELGLTREALAQALSRAHEMRPWYTILGREGISAHKAERLLRYCLVA
jgi:glycerol-1-phosphate dehydrogenase [NAD(P)+]